MASLAAPYRHARLSAIKIADNSNNQSRFKDDATLKELLAEVQKHLAILAPVLDLEVLMAPGDGIANRDAWQPGAGNDTGSGS